MTGFEPIIGGGFDQIAGQRAGWAGLSANIEGQNLQRQAQAEQAHNQWLAQVAAIQRQQEADQVQQAQYAASLAAQQQQRAQDAAIQESQFSRSLAASGALENQRIAAENARTAATERGMQQRLDYQDRQQNLAIDNTGATLAGSYALSSRALAEAQAKQADLEAQQEQNAARLEELNAKPAKKLTPEEIAEKTTLTTQQRTLSKALKTHESLVKSLTDKHQSLVTTRMEPHGYSVDEAQGFVIHEPTLKKWSFRQRPVQAPEGWEETEAGSGWLMPQRFAAAPTTTGTTAPPGPPPPWAGFTPQVQPTTTQATGTQAPAPILAPTTPVQPTATASTYRVGDPIPGKSYREGDLVRGKTDGKPYLIVNGVPVPQGAATAQQQPAWAGGLRMP